jgi:hypothetical protein
MQLRWYIALLFVILGYFYYNATVLHAKTINTSLSHSDQASYVEFAQKVCDSGFSYTGKRNRMPLYPYLQALFYDPTLNTGDFFEQGKHVNIILSFFLVGSLFFVFRHFLSLHRTVLLTLIITAEIFIYRAPYFTSESLYYFLSFLGFLGMGIMLIRPSLFRGIITGVFLALAYLTKASLLPAIIAFVFVFILKTLSLSYDKAKIKKDSLSKQEVAYNFFSLGLTLAVFLLIMFPYLNAPLR